jgi:hypothetical protein
MEPDEMLRTLNRFVIEDIKVDGFIFTMGAADGLTDVWNGNDEILGVEGLEKIVRETATASFHHIVQRRASS